MGKTIIKNGRRVFANNPNLNFSRWLYMKEHKLTKEQMEGKEVHHVDGNKLNDDIENLVLLDKEVHQKIQQQLWIHKNPNISFIIFIGLSLAFFYDYKILSNGDIFFYIGIILLIVPCVIIYFPKFLRKILFSLGFIEKNKK